MNGPQHYQQAEKYVRILVAPNVADMTHDDLQTTLAAAQVHATLAVAAALVDMSHETYGPEWDAVTE